MGAATALARRRARLRSDFSPHMGDTDRKVSNGRAYGAERVLTGNGEGQGAGDARSVAARRRRAATREKLLAAALEVFLGNPGRDAIAEDVMQAAGVSRATFYKYFDSLDDAASTLGRQLADETVREVRHLAADMESPLERASLGAQMLMTRGALQPGWGRFVLQSNHLSGDSEYQAAVRRTTLQARQRGLFSFVSTRAAVDFQIGAVMEGIRRLTMGQEHPRAYIGEMALMTLRGVGADPAQAAAAVARVSAYLAEIGSHKLLWWREFR